MRCEDCGVSYLSRSQFDDHECEPIKYCEAKGCKIRVTDSEKYCTQHPKLCQGWLGKGCEYGVRYNETYCIYCQITLRKNYYASLPDSYHCTSYSCCSNWVSIRGKHCSYHQEQKKNEQNQLKSLVRQKTTLTNPQGVTTFTTWWNNNLATVINGNYSYTLWIIVYEPATKSMSKVLEKFEISNGYDKYSLDSTKSKASSVRNELNGANPILAIIGSYGSISVSTLLSEPYVLRLEIPHKVEEIWEYGYACTSYFVYNYPSNPDEYLKPLDIVKVKNKKGTTYFHFAIYLGKNKICHITSNNQGAKIENWSDFLDDGVGELYRYHLPIPFKKWDDTLRQIVKAALSHYKRGEYNLCNDNCEHYAWEQITGIDYSGQAVERPDGASFVDFWRLRGNHGMRHWTSVNLQSMIRNSSQRFDNLKSSDNYEVRNKISEIKGSESEWQTKIEVPYKPNCQIM